MAKQHRILSVDDQFLIHDLRSDEVLLRYFPTRQAALDFADDPPEEGRWVPHRQADTDPVRVRLERTYFFLGRDDDGTYAAVVDVDQPKEAYRG
ncbi:MAG: hypothetical protein AAGD06_28695, partial [Acidobacteriota bacterium]